MNRKPLPSQHLLRERYDYDGEHLINRRNMSGRGGGIGSIVGRLNMFGYRVVKFNGQRYKEYRLIWMWYYGEEIPEDKEIDHIDNDRDNNKIENLRLVSHQENQLNRKDTKENGVLWKDNPIRLERMRIRYHNLPEEKKRELGRRYHNLTEEEKKEHNRKCNERAKQRKMKLDEGE